MAENSHFLRIKQFCESLHYGILKEEEGENAWSLFCDVRDSVILIDRPENMGYCYVVYTLHLSEEGVTKILDQVDADPQFVFDLKSAVYNPLTVANFIGEDDHFRGFHILKKMFVQEPGFSLKEFDETLQAVLGTGLLGTAFVRSVIGKKEIEEKIIEEIGGTSPEGMFY